MADFPSQKAHPYLKLLKFIFGPLLFLLGPVRYRNVSNVPLEGGLIILANHLSDSDPMIVQGASPRGIHFMSKSELWDIPILKNWLKTWGSFPVKRGAPDRASLRLASELAKDGRAVGIFPEGMLSETGKLQEIREGAALIIRMSGVPVICCGIKNTNRIIPYGKLIPRPSFRAVTATWGEVKTFTKENSNEEIVEWIEAEFRRLIPEPKES